MNLEVIQSQIYPLDHHQRNTASAGMLLAYGVSVSSYLMKPSAFRRYESHMRKNPWRAARSGVSEPVDCRASPESLLVLQVPTWPWRNNVFHLKPRGPCSGAHGGSLGDSVRICQRKVVHLWSSSISYHCQERHSAMEKCCVSICTLSEHDWSGDQKRKMI